VQAAGAAALTARAELAGVKTAGASPAACRAAADRLQASYRTFMALDPPADGTAAQAYTGGALLALQEMLRAMAGGDVGAEAAGLALAALDRAATAVGALRVTHGCP
jgi:hypothetical protein